MKYTKALLVLVTLFLYGLSAYAVTTDDLNYLCFTAQQDGSTVALNKQNSPYSITLQYSTDKDTWKTYTIGNTITLSKIGDKVYFRATSTNSNFSKESDTYYNFSMSGKIAASGNVMSLLDKTCKTLTLPDYAFCRLFQGCASLTSAPTLPATTMTTYCYRGMFEDCSSLVTAPTLPATTLALCCYDEMFWGCTNLINAPALLATTLAESCYAWMFYKCTSLVNAPALPATALAEDCYDYMFGGCTSLKIAPALPATTLAEGCYYSMFTGCTGLVNAPALPAKNLAERCYMSMFTSCTSLKTAPALPATTLVKSCYLQMFDRCTSLVNAPALPATTLVDGCYTSMFMGCESLVNAPELPATKLTNGCYFQMFINCKNLSNIHVGFRSWPTDASATQNWVSGVKSKGVFVAPCELPDERGVNYIPKGWSFECTKEDEHTDIFLPYDATELTPEQEAANPIHLAYPTAMQDKMPTIQCGDIPSEGRFSVSATDKVRFARGNLQYQASTEKWRFAEHQYDYVGDSVSGNVYANGIKSDNAQISSTYSGWIDLFGWGTSGYNNKYPYMTSTTYSDYGDGEKDIAGTNYDWGVYNKIGTDPKGTWRTLTKDEWGYLYCTRKNAADLWGHGTVNGVTGTILLPDDWVLPSGLSFVAGTSGMPNQGTYFIGSGNHFNDNIYTTAQWEQMEAAGACFLPSAGFRDGTTMDYVQTLGYYWSSSYYNSSNVYGLYFFSSYLGPQDYNYRYYGRSVRLVRTL